MQISVRSQTAAQTTLSWQPVAGAARYRILWSDRSGETVRFKTAGAVSYTHLDGDERIAVLRRTGGIVRQAAGQRCGCQRCEVGRLALQRDDIAEAAHHGGQADGAGRCARTQKYTVGAALSIDMVLVDDAVVMAVACKAAAVVALSLIHI